MKRLACEKTRGMLFMALALIVSMALFSCQKRSETPSVEGVGTVSSPDGVEIHYAVQGTGMPALVFVHCWCCNQTFWDHQVEHFFQKYTVVTIDLAGHGKSGLERKEWSIPAFGQDVVAVVEQLDLDQIVLIGHSMGGPVIMEVAAQMPERTIGLVGVDNFQNMDQTWPQEQLEEFLRPMRENFSEVTKEFVLSMFPPTADSMLVEQIAAILSSTPPEVGIGAMEANFRWRRENFPAISQKIMAPLHCISSDLWPTNVQVNRKYFPSFDVSLMPGRGHFVHLEDPETFNRLLEEVVQSFVAASPPDQGS